MRELQVPLRNKNRQGTICGRAECAKPSLLLRQRKWNECRDLTGTQRPRMSKSKLIPCPNVAHGASSEFRQGNPPNPVRPHPNPPEPEQPTPQPPQPEIPPSGPEEPTLPSPGPEPLPTPVPGPTDPGLPRPVLILD